VLTSPTTQCHRADSIIDRLRSPGYRAALAGDAGDEHAARGELAALEARVVAVRARLAAASGAGAPAAGAGYY
jgi:hypothetical protein